VLSVVAAACGVLAMPLPGFLLGLATIILVLVGFYRQRRREREARGDG
jgi:hypothetical protein